jgi:hypothetical protein
LFLLASSTVAADGGVHGRAMLKKLRQLVFFFFWVWCMHEAAIQNKLLLLPVLKKPKTITLLPLLLNWLVACSGNYP